MNENDIPIDPNKAIQDRGRNERDKLNIYSITDVFFDPIDRIINTTNRGVDITIKIVHGFPVSGGTGSKPGYFSDNPTLIVNSLDKLSNSIVGIRPFGGGYTYFYDGTNWALENKYFWVDATHIVIKFVIRWMAGSVTFNVGEQNLRAFLISPKIVSQDSSTDTWSGSGNTVYYQNFEFDVEGTQTDTGSGTYTMTNADFHIMGSDKFIGKYGTEAF